MLSDIETVKSYYDGSPQIEWERLEQHPFEFRITMAMMEQYIKPGQRILDIGGGPGRYSLTWARRGADVALLDLSGENTRFAADMARLRGLKLRTVTGDARYADQLISGTFDHVFLMGPMYHLLDETDRIQTMEAALRLLKPGGKLYVSFITLFAGMIFAMKELPQSVCDPKETGFIDCVLNNRPFSGDGFTRTHMATIEEITELMELLPMKKLCLFGQEGIVSPQEPNILAQPQPVIDRWFELALKLCQRPDLMAYSEHVMYIGERT